MGRSHRGVAAPFFHTRTTALLAVLVFSLLSTDGDLTARVERSHPYLPLGVKRRDAGITRSRRGANGVPAAVNRYEKLRSTAPVVTSHT